MPDAWIAALLGLVGGVIGSLVAPWVQWAIEKRRTQMANRKETIANFREAIRYFDFSQRSFGETEEYSILKPYLSKELVEAIEHGRTLVIGREGRGSDGIRAGLLDEATRIEKRWGLI